MYKIDRYSYVIGLMGAWIWIPGITFSECEAQMNGAMGRILAERGFFLARKGLRNRFTFLVESSCG